MTPCYALRVTDLLTPTTSSDDTTHNRETIRTKWRKIADTEVLKYGEAWESKCETDTISETSAKFVVESDAIRIDTYKMEQTTKWKREHTAPPLAF